MANPAVGHLSVSERLPVAAGDHGRGEYSGDRVFVTSGDSGALVLSNFTSILKNVNSDAPIWMRILWSAIIAWSRCRCF